jgi:hypothetical protein
MVLISSFSAHSLEPRALEMDASLHTLGTSRLLLAALALLALDVRAFASLLL